MVTKEETWGMDKSGAWNEHIHTTIYKIKYSIVLQALCLSDLVP